MGKEKNNPPAIWVYASHSDGELDAVALELLGKGKELCEPQAMRLEAVLIGHEVSGLAEKLLEYGATTVYQIDDPRLQTFSTSLYARLLADLARERHPGVLLLGADPRHAALAARTAVRLETGLSAHCVDLKFERGQLVQTVPGFGGNIMANIVCPVSRPQMATVNAGVFKAAPGRAPEARVVNVTPVIPDALPVARLVETKRHPESPTLPLEKAGVVVAGGYGVGSKENWQLIEKLARRLNGAVGATRPPVDEGWAGASQMIGASGKVIAPDLYICAGVSGMMHHTVGIHKAKTIVAVNSDPKAPIFSMADYGLVGDLKDILAALIQQLETGSCSESGLKPPENTHTAEEYEDSLRRLRPNIYKFGRLVEDPVDDPLTRRTVAGHAQTFRAARDPRYQDLLTTVSHLSGKRVSRYLSLLGSAEDMFANSKLKRLMFQMTGTCTGGRCAGWAVMNAMWSTSWDIDHDLGTDYHQRLKAWLLSAQERDITVAGALTDAKGQRRQPPSRQPNPDAYLRIVKRRSDGVVVRGAKAMICGIAAANEIFVMPTTRLRREESDYAIAFAIPKDAPGLTIVEARHISDERDLESGFDNPVRHGGITQAFLFFEDVFVPTERIFMCGEAAYAGDAVFRFTLPYRSAIGGCVAGQGDVMIGAAILIARANGLDEKVFRDKITQMIINNETTFGLGLAAAVMGTPHPSGAWLPDPILAHANKVYVATLPYETKRLTQEIAGGIAETGCMPSYTDFVDSRYGHLIQKYLTANSPAETRMRIARLIEWLTVGGGVPGCMHGGGSPDGAKMIIYSQANFDAMIDMAKRIGEIADISLTKPPAR
jgi:4-hydroxybutyryl-CoA dehydratase / vinylacetyl-CoA-Delta-isomerase